LNIEYSEDKPGEIAPGGGRYYFEIGYKKKLVKLYLKEGIISEEFIVYSKLAHQCRKENVPMRDDDQEKLLQLRQELAKSIMSSSPEDMFVIIN